MATDPEANVVIRRDYFMRRARSIRADGGDAGSVSQMVKVARHANWFLISSRKQRRREKEIEYDIRLLFQDNKLIEWRDIRMKLCTRGRSLFEIREAIDRMKRRGDIREVHTAYGGRYWLK